MTDLVIRPLTAGEEDLFESLPDPGLVGFAAFGDTFSARTDRLRGRRSTSTPPTSGLRDGACQA
jgi:hypothetical protein